MGASDASKREKAGEGNADIPMQVCNTSLGCWRRGMLSAPCFGWAVGMGGVVVQLGCQLTVFCVSG